jgi:hypothetical protein
MLSSGEKKNARFLLFGQRKKRGKANEKKGPGVFRSLF